ncbi:MAG: efflux RND transporter periplasmic adaptor subunit [Oscillospiraceae bacterium]|nr:efflux RND transporter periplasmic adaptor subunit [Oscillospiraceae bacterium]
MGGIKMGQHRETEIHTANQEQDEALFRSLQKKKKARKRKTIRTVVIVFVLAAIAVTTGVIYLRRRVAMSLVSDTDVSSASAERGTITTTVSGSGTLANVDEEVFEVPAGIEIEEILVNINDKVQKGDVIATVDQSSVLSAMEAMQKELDSLDEKIFDARDDTVQNYITSGVEGILQRIYVQTGDSVPDAMAEYGCLAEILLPNGQVIRVTGLAGTIAQIYLQEGQQVYSGSVLFTLNDTYFSATYDSYVQQRQEKEELLLALIRINRDGAVLAPYNGSVSSVDYDEDADYSDTEAFSLVTLSPDFQMEVSISVDETDILSLDLGQQAQITVSSIGEDTYRGEVTEINKTATSSSGVTRYSAVITMSKEAEMLPGMTAKAVISITGVENALIIPAEALHQTSSSSYVYTSYDEELGTFGGLVEVEAGISNSESTEIISGLKEGDVVYYIESDDDPFAMFGGGNMGRGNQSVGMSGNPGGNPGGGRP